MRTANPAPQAEQLPEQLTFEVIEQWVDPRPVVATVTDDEQLIEVVERIGLELSLEPLLGVDIETTSLHPKQGGRIRLLQLATRRGTYVIDLDSCIKLDELQQLVLESPSLKLAHNAGFEANWISDTWGAPPCRLRDTRAAYLACRAASGGRTDRGGSRLVDLAEALLGHTLDKSEQVSDWSGLLTEDQLRYAATDASILLSLWDILTPQIAQHAIPESEYTTTT